MIDRCELKSHFNSVGMPIGEIALSDIMERLDTDHDGTIDLSEFKAALSFCQPKEEEKRWNWMKGRVLSSFQSFVKKDDLKLDSYQLSDVEKLESINICCSETTTMYAQSSWAELVFAIFLKGKSDPLVLVCSKPEHRFAWVDAFRTCFVKSTQMKADSGFESARRLCKEVGWQHSIIRASIFSLVVCHDFTGLERQLSMLGSSPYVQIDEKDKYHGYTALHYAVILFDVACAKLLIKHGADLNLLDNDEKSPLDHGERSLISLK